MLVKIIAKLYAWSLKRTMKIVKKKKLTEGDKKKIEFVKDMKRLLGFVTWLNTKGLRNRRERKTFWRNVSHGENTLEDTLNNLIELYSKKDEKKNKRPLKEGRGEKPDTEKPKL